MIYWIQVPKNKTVLKKRVSILIAILRKKRVKIARKENSLLSAPAKKTLSSIKRFRLG